ncbi:MAG TPA: hypothetical protein VFE55_20550 [Acidimicrobiia bacterium]|nr:hypothetical protein [Acidimicrobiia bacterium]
MKKCFAAIMLAAMVLGAVPAHGAPADDDFFRLAGRRNWLSFADARPVSPFFGIPGELRPGAPFARSYLDASPGRSECFAALYYPDDVVEEGVLQTTGHYENKTEARSNNPDVGRGVKQEVAPLGMAGPHAATDNPKRTECASEAASAVGPGEGQLLADGGFARTKASFDGDKILTDEAVSRVMGISAGPIRIATLETRLKLEYHLDGEPVITYAMTIAGLENAGQPVAGVGAQGIVLAGQKVAGRDVIDQFNSEVAKNGAALKDKAWSDYIQLVAPSVQKDGDGGVHVAGPAVEVGQVNTFRAGQGGSHFGLRLGYASVYAILNSLESEVPDLGAPTETTPGTPSPLDSTPPPASSASAGPGSISAGSATPSAAGGGLLSGAGDMGAGLASAASPPGLGAGGGYGSTGPETGTTPAAPPDQSALPAAGSTLPGLGSLAAPRAGGVAAAQLAAETRKAARNTANGLLGGILVMAGALIWVAGMAIFGRKGA